MNDDLSLLREWALQHDERAFSTLVVRYSALVWSSCRRHLPDAASADDATQAVFLLLAAKAGSLLQRQWWGPRGVADWLHATAIRTAGNARRAETRRSHHERQGAIAMQDLHDAAAASTEVGREPEGSLDEALRGLSRRYREPVVMHFLGARSRSDIARELGVSEAAVHKRIARGLGKLRMRLGPAALVLLLQPPALAPAQAIQHAERVCTCLPGQSLSPLGHAGAPWGRMGWAQVVMGLLIAIGALVVLGISQRRLARPGSTSVVASSPVLAPTRDQDASGPLETARARGLAFLLAAQDPFTGTWDGGTFPKTAVTALAIRALDTWPAPSQSPALIHARSLALGWLAARARSRQGLLGVDSPQTYIQAFATLVLAEHQHEISDGPLLVQEAASILLAAQSTQGGWRYSLTPHDSDLSVTSDVSLALLEAQRQGACDAHRALARAMLYLQDCFDPRSGGFYYTPAQRPNPEPTNSTPAVVQPLPGAERQTAYRTAIGSLVLMRLCGASLSVERAHRALAAGWMDEVSSQPLGDAFASESLSSDAQNMPEWAARRYPVLLREQQTDGSWNVCFASVVLDTALALRALAPSPASAGWQVIARRAPPAAVTSPTGAADRSVPATMAPTAPSKLSPAGRSAF